MIGVALKTTLDLCVSFFLNRDRSQWIRLVYPHGQGLSNFHNSQAFVGGFSAFAQTFVFAFFSFGGIELVAVAAGESAKPYKAVPRAIKATFFRILLFYILTILTIGLCINYQDETLLTASFGVCTPIILGHSG
jgi:amino acid permease